jgi:RNAse (barnase) inhibitor barstar
MTEIVLDGAAWKTAADFYLAFLGAVQAPEWHGHSLDALWDSITAGDINGHNLPYTVRILGTEKMAPEARTMLDRFRSLVEDAKNEGFQIELVCDLTVHRLSNARRSFISNIRCIGSTGETSKSKC